MSATNIQNHLMIGKETTFNTAVVPNILVPIKNEGGLNTDVKAEAQSDMKGFVAKNTAITQGVREHAGDYKMDFLHEATGNILLGAIGSVSSALASGETIVYKHSFTETVTTPSWTVEQKIADAVRRFSGVKFAGFKIITDAGNSAVQLEIPALAASNVDASALTPSASVDDRFTFDQVDVKLAGSINCKVTKCELEYKNNAEAIATLCKTKDPSVIVNGGTELNVNLEMLLDSTGYAEYKKMVDSDTTIRLDLILTGESIGVGSNYKLEIGIPLNKYTSADMPFGDGSSAIVTLSTQAFSNTGSLFDQFDLTNLTATY